MAGTLPEAHGWITAHRDIVKRAVGAVTIEHLGSTEWVDTGGTGYHGTGKNEPYVLSTTLGRATKLVKRGVAEHNLRRHMVVAAPGISVGSEFHRVGVPHAGGIAGPTYLLVVSKNGEMDKLDARLAARQTAFYADVIRGFDRAGAEELRRGDPSLGSEPLPADDASTPVQCGPANRFVVDAGKGHRLAVRVYARVRRDRGILVTVAAVDGAVRGVTVECVAASACMRARRRSRPTARSVACCSVAVDTSASREARTSWSSGVAGGCWSGAAWS